MPHKCEQRTVYAEPDAVLVDTKHRRDAQGPVPLSCVSTHFPSSFALALDVLY